MESKIEAANACIVANTKQAVAISFVPLVSIPLVHGICVKMIVQLDKIFGIPTDKGFSSEIFHDILTGIVIAPAMAVPVLGAGVAHFYIKTVGEYYVKAVASVLDSVEKEKVLDRAYISNRINKELQNIHMKQRTQRMIAK